jgi:hypothetical protein
MPLTIGITLIEIPYWWDMTIDKLEATIKKVKPALITHPGKRRSKLARCIHS